MELIRLLKTGKTAEIYQLEDGRVLKLFHESIKESQIDEEYKKAKIAMKYDFHWAQVYEKVKVLKRTGIIYEEAKGVSLYDMAMKGAMCHQCAGIFASEHRRILDNMGGKLPDIHEVYRDRIKKLPELKRIERSEYLRMAKKLPRQDHLCHGDYHLGNVYVEGESGPAKILSYDKMAKGHPFWDVARTVYLVEMTPPPKEAPNREQIMGGKKSIVQNYLAHMGISRNNLRDFIAVVAVARLAESITEEERALILRMIRGEQW